jgi:hypothetical protein
MLKKTVVVFAVMASLTFAFAMSVQAATLQEIQEFVQTLKPQPIPGSPNRLAGLKWVTLTAQKDGTRIHFVAVVKYNNHPPSRKVGLTFVLCRRLWDCDYAIADLSGDGIVDFYARQVDATKNIWKHVRKEPILFRVFGGAQEVFDMIIRTGVTIDL